MRLAEQKKIVPVMTYADLSGTVYSDSIDMKGYHRATFLFILHALGGADSTLTVYSGATDAACTSALSFHYAFGGAAVGSASCDVLAADTEAATLALTYGTYSGFMLVVDIDATKMDVANAENWLTCKFTTQGSVTGRVSGFAILEPRYTGNLSATALT